MNCDINRKKPLFRETIAQLTAVSLSLITALALLRALYEGTFPRLPFLADPFPNMLFAGVTAVTSAFVWKRLAREAQSAWLSTAVFTPFLLNLIYLPKTAVNPQLGNFLLFTSIWFAALLAAHLLRPNAPRWRDALFLFIYAAPIYLLTMGRTVGKADSFEFQVVIPQLEIAHPTGYPLYILLTKLFTLIPIGGMAWRVNMITAVYALITLYLLYELMRRLTSIPIIGVLTAVLFALTPTFWSQATAAEVYSLNSLIVTAALLLMLKITRKTAMAHPLTLAAVLGLGLTNHLTTVILLPPATLTLFFARKTYKLRLTNILLLTAAFLTPLLLYAYLPIRWQALHGEPMGAARFIDWVVAGRFRGALQLGAWLHDTTRYAVVGRLFIAEWTSFYLLLGASGFLLLAKKQRRAAFTLTLIFAGYSFYALNYYVPDIAVFLIPAHIIIAIFIGTMASWIVNGRNPATPQLRNFATPQPRNPVLLAALALPMFAQAGMETWPQVDQSGDDGLTRWGEAVLALPLAENGAILADSEKIAPLYYLQQAEGVRPDLEIMVLPDEAAYRAELDARIAVDQPVYLARYLPALQSIYYLRAMGPLTAVSTRPLTDLPADATSVSQHFKEIDLVGYAIETNASSASGHSAITLYWQADAPSKRPLHIYTRWQNGDPINPAGSHPVHNNYPTNAWRADEIVPDFHLLPRPISPIAQDLGVQIAIAPPFTPAAELEWQTVTIASLPAATDAPITQEHRILLGETAVSGSSSPTQLRPGEPLQLLLHGYGNSGVTVNFAGKQNKPTQIGWEAGNPFVTMVEIGTEGVENGRYPLTLPAKNSTCGWMRAGMSICTIGEVEISGVSLPADAINYDDKIGLLNIELPDTFPEAGALPITLHWQALAPIDEDYTIFIQLLDENDKIMGQIDAWPLQGTYPTSQWATGEIIADPYMMQLNREGGKPTRLLFGYYLLADLRRLPVLDANGTPIDDKWELSID